MFLPTYPSEHVVNAICTKTTTVKAAEGGEKDEVEKHPVVQVANTTIYPWTMVVHL